MSKEKNKGSLLAKILPLAVANYFFENAPQDVVNAAEAEAATSATSASLSNRVSDAPNNPLEAVAQAAVDAAFSPVAAPVADAIVPVAAVETVETLRAELAAERANAVSLKADADAYKAIKPEYDTMKAFQANHQQAIGAVVIADVAGTKPPKKTAADEQNQAVVDDIERLRAEYPKLMEGL